MDVAEQIAAENPIEETEKKKPHHEDEEFEYYSEDDEGPRNEDGSKVNDGFLRMTEVRELPDDVDDIIYKLKNVDYGEQDLDVLIELAKQLK